MTRNRTVDVVRGIAILAIIFGHLGVSMIARVVFTFHVPVFFIISGYFMTDRPLYAYIRRKARTLLVPYAVTCGVMVVIAAMVALVNGADVGKTALEWIGAAVYGSGVSYSSPFPIKQIGAIWFLWASFWGCIAFQVSLKWSPLARLLWVMALFAAGFLSARHLFWFPLSIQAGACAVLYIHIGYCLKQGRKAFDRVSTDGRLMGTTIAVAVWLSFIRHFDSFWLVSCSFGRGVENIAGSLCACYCVFLLAGLIERHAGKAAEALSFIGRNSIIVLCVHITEMNMIEWRDFIVHLTAVGIPELICDGIAVGLKLTLIVLATVLLTRSKITRKVFAVKQTT